MVVDPFCFRQFAEHDASKSYGGTVFSLPVAEFEDIVNSRFEEANLKDGYAPFCKHIFLVNDFTDAKVNVLPLTKENEHLVRTEYAARSDKELPILQRFVPLDLIGGAEKLPVAKYLDLILYSREQVREIFVVDPHLKHVVANNLSFIWTLGRSKKKTKVWEKKREKRRRLGAL